MISGLSGDVRSLDRLVDIAPGQWRSLQRAVTSRTRIREAPFAVGHKRACTRHVVSERAAAYRSGVCLPSDQTLLTQHGLLLGTPEYTSPEQPALGRFDRDVTTDVYSLGVLMYELISSRPFERGELEKKGYAESLRVIREEEPLRPASEC